MVVNIPTKSKAIVQDNKNKYSGNIWSSFNIDFNHGDIRLAPRGLMATDATGIGTPTDFLAINNGFIATTDDFAMITGVGDPEGSWTKVSTGAAGSEVYPNCDKSSSIVEFNGDVAYISSATDIAKYDLSTIDNTWWTTLGASSLNNSYSHPLCVGFNNLMLIGNGTSVHAVDIYDNVFEDIVTIPNTFEILWIISSSNMYWIGTKVTDGNSYKASIFTWDGASDNFNSQYVVNAGVTYAGALLNDVLHIVTDKGAVLKFNGGGFIKVAGFPNYGKNYLLKSSNVNEDLPIHRNGMTTIGDNLYININAEPYTFDGSISKEEFPSGIWVYNQNTGLSHCAASSLGTQASPARDYGQRYITKASALKGMYVGSAYRQESLLFGAEDMINFTDYQESNRSNYRATGGYVITPRIESEEIEETFEKLFVKSDNHTGGTITLKYRTEEKYTDTEEGTWINSSSFTTTADLDVGDEIEVLNGLSSGNTGYIKSISGTGTFTITLETAVPIVTSVGFYFLPNNFKLLGVITEDSLSVTEISIMKDAEWIQIKAEIISGGDTPIIKEITLKSTIKTQYEQ